jgi:hypothetical protein
MTAWDQTYSHNFLLALDLWGALVLFNRAGITISTMSGMVWNGKDTPLKLWGWQRALLRWIAPRLGRAHVAAALKADRGRAQFVIDNTPGA